MRITMRNELILLFIYFSGRLLFLDPNSLAPVKKEQTKELFKRMAWGLWSFLLIQNIISAAILFLVNGLMIAGDLYLRFSKEKQSGRLYLTQIVQAVILWPWLIQKIHFSIPALSNPIARFLETIVPLFYQSGSSADTVLLIMLGYLFVLKESTIFIRLILSSIPVAPETDTPQKQKDNTELDRGKIIGILERSFYYFLILSDNFGGIAIIIALKSLARYKRLEEKEFAQYFLIGSLLSLAAAAVPASIIRLLM